MTNYLKITLESDLCAGSGYSYAGVVDNDTCYDQYGLPYFPARRLKGCLREAAELIGTDTSLFGAWGQDVLNENTPVQVENAYPEGYSDLVAAVQGEPELLIPSRVLELFTRVKTQTRVNDAGCADPNTLRSVRIVNQYSPLSGEKQVFYARLEIDPKAENRIDELKRVVKALRHIGYNRNRGLGNVRCELISEREMKKPTETVTLKVEGSLRDEEEGVLEYGIKTLAPLVISKNDANDTEKYINGQSVLGFFASEYLKTSGHSADETFEHLFLRDEVCFLPLYPSDEDWKPYIPAPSYLRQLKKSKEMVNVSRPWPKNNDEKYGEKAANGSYYPGNGNQPKKLAGKFVRIGEGGVMLREVGTELIYHHRHAKKEQEEQLYALEAIQEGQRFCGRIAGKGKDLKLLASILEKGRMSFGKSRSAQYGSCQILFCRLRKKTEKTMIIKPGQSVLVTLETDGVFADPVTAGYSVRTEEVCAQIAAVLARAAGTDVKDLTANGSGGDSPYMELDVRVLNGHYSVWNLKRPSVPCVSAGSTFEFKNSKKTDLLMDTELLFAGVWRGEGFGKLSVILKTDSWTVKKEIAEKTEPKKSVIEGTAAYQLCSQVAFSILRNRVEERAIKARESALTASAVGRIILMMEECCYEYPGKTKEAKAALDKRIRGIKDEAKKKKAQTFVKNYYDEALKAEDEEIAEYRYLTDAQKEQLKMDCLKQALVALKYSKKEETGDEV